MRRDRQCGGRQPFDYRRGGANNINGDSSTIGGGYTNVISNHNAFLGGGTFNSVAGQNATLGGGNTNAAAGSYSFLGGGSGNNIPGGFSHAVLVGGVSNTASHNAVFVGGGKNNTAGGSAGENSFATVCGGFGNSALARKATVAGGGRSNEGNDTTGNRATDDFGFVGGGGNNQAGDNAGTTLDRPFATVAGGNSNTASGDRATVGGGTDNTASALASTVPGGSSNTAAGQYSFAAGRRAKANDNGSFVWGESSAFDVATATANEFVARAVGGFRFITSIDGAGAPLAGASLASGSGSWASLSDQNSKENFAPVDGASLLARLNRIPILSWNYRAQEPTIRHLGPMAQDFRAAFGLGEDERHISTVDADGVALAAVQELYRMGLKKDEQIRELQQAVRALHAELEQLKVSMTKR